MAVHDSDPLDRLFPLDGGIHPLDELRMGYDDLSDNLEATALLESLDGRSVQAIHRFTFSGPTSVIEMVGHLTGLVEGLDSVDPHRASQGALEEAGREVDLGRALLEAYCHNPRLPLLGRLLTPEDTSPDAVKIGWGVIDTAEEQMDAELYLPTVDVLEHYMRDPAAARAAYDKARLDFLNDVLFRPGVSISRY